MANRSKQNDALRKSVLAELPGVLREQRARLRLSQEGLAHGAGIDRSYMGNIEQGLAEPTISVLFKISSALQLKPSQLVALLESRGVQWAQENGDGPSPTPSEG